MSPILYAFPQFVKSNLHTISTLESFSHNPFVPLKVSAIGPDLAGAGGRLSAAAVSHLSQPLQHLTIDSHHMTSSTKCHLSYYCSPARGCG